MSRSRTSRSTRIGLILLAAALGLTLVSFALGNLWATLLVIFNVPARTAEGFHTLWIPLSGLIVDGGIAVLGALGFVLLWRGRWELGSPYAARMGLAALAFVVAAVAYVLWATTGLLVGSLTGLTFLVPWHGLLALIGGVALGCGLYWMLANLPISGARPVAAIALALGFAGIAILNLADFGFRRVRVAGLDGAGLGLALASVILWMVLCLWAQESLRSLGTGAPASATVDG